MSYTLRMAIPKVRRSTFTVDLGAERKARLQAAAAALGLTPSQWTLELIQRELASAKPPAKKSEPPTPTPTQPARLVLDPELTQLLNAIKDQGQFRSRPAVLRMLLRSYNGQAPTPMKPIDAAPLKDAVAALMRSNHELLPIGTNLNQIAKQLNALQGVFTTANAKQLTVFAGEVRAHVAKAARVAADLGALLTPHRR